MGGRGSSSGMSGSGGSSNNNKGDSNSTSSIAKQVVQVTKLSSLPTLEGSTNDVSEAKVVRNNLGKTLQRYALTDNGKASPEIVNKYLSGTAEDKAAFVKERAEQMTFGNSSLLGDKIKSEISNQNRFAERYTRFTEVITNNKSAKWWTSQGNTIVATKAAKDYIDGKAWNESIFGKKKK